MDLPNENNEPLEQPPPSYAEAVNFQIRRKPIGAGGDHKGQDGPPSITTTRAQAEAIEQQILAAQNANASGLSSQRHLHISTHPAGSHSSVTDTGLAANGDTVKIASTAITSHADPSPTGQREQAGPGDWKHVAAAQAQKALEDAKHFIGGLIARPSVSTKHYSIVRHSHGIVFYQGSNTFLAISIFSDELLPVDRTIWMQCKGWSGKAGMRAKALFGLNDSWLNVTPTVAIQPDQVTSGDERAWQRDIKRFKKKTANSPQARHLLRQTAIIRIPVEATDGYYQLILCRGENKRKSLCTSPVFRVVSASCDPSSLRGASLSTLPLELGAWAGSMYARTVASTFVAPITSRIETVTQAVLPSTTTQIAAQTAYSNSKLADRVDSNLGDAGARYDEAMGQQYARLDANEFDINAGPMAPYPVTFNARTDVQVQPPIFDSTGVPKLRLNGVPSHVSQRLNGHYFAWCRIHGRDSNAREVEGNDVSAWHQCIISASNAVLQERVTNVRSQGALRVSCFIRFVEPVEIPPSVQLQVRIMGFIRFEAPPSFASTDPSREAEDRMVLDACDLELTQSTLDHPAWHPDAPPAIPTQCSVQSASETGTPARNLVDKGKDTYTNARLAGQRMIDQIPFHRIGIRMRTEELRDKYIGISGFYIPR